MIVPLGIIRRWVVPALEIGPKCDQSTGVGGEGDGARVDVMAQEMVEIGKMSEEFAELPKERAAETVEETRGMADEWVEIAKEMVELVAEMIEIAEQLVETWQNMVEMVELTKERADEMEDLIVEFLEGQLLPESLSVAIPIWRKEVTPFPSDGRLSGVQVADSEWINHHDLAM
jgi:hypothetical protein